MRMGVEWLELSDREEGEKRETVVNTAKGVLHPYINTQNFTCKHMHVYIYVCIRIYIHMCVYLTKHVSCIHTFVTERCKWSIQVYIIQRRATGGGRPRERRTERERERERERVEMNGSKVS